MTPQQRTALARAMIIISRYRAETPLGHQPYMLAGQADEALHELNRALDVPTEQEPEPFTEWLICPKCNYKSPYSPIKAKTLEEDAERITKQARSSFSPSSAGRGVAYDLIDRFLSNNLNSDEDYAEYSKALDLIYTTPPQRKPLTDEQRRTIVAKLSEADYADGDEWDSALIDEVEAAHGIKE